MEKILTSPSSFGKVGDEPIEILQNEGFEVINNPYGRKLTEEEVVELAKDCIGIVAGVETYSEEVLQKLKKLKVISRVGVGMDSIDMEAAKRKGIIVINTPDGPTRSVAELTIGLTMSLLRKIPLAHKNMRNKIWKKETGNLLYNKKVGIVGLGRIGKTVAKLFQGLGNEVYGYDINFDKTWANENNVSYLDLYDLLRTCDVITIHIPPSPNKKPLIGKTELDMLKKESFLINVSRGSVVDEKELYNKLIKNEIAGAAIDVFSNEPYQGELCDIDNVVLTPHLGSYTKEGKLQMEIDAVNNLVVSLK